MCANVLVAEDDPRQAEVLRRYLEAEGHRPTMVTDGDQAVATVRAGGIDLVVLDVLMPALDGVSACRLIRARSDVPILMLTALGEDDDVLLGLDTGADDYVTKPYSPRQLMGRIRTLLRRAPVTPRNVRRAGGLTVDLDRHQVHLDGREIPCTPDEFGILAALADVPGRVFSRAQLLGHTAGQDRESTERTIDSHVKNLRRKIEENPRRPRRLLAVYGVGYKLCG
ncbi:response regulator transcription factor [Actinoplanes couchii]|uniref:DNA-binding response regulator n=1 Tax=Actinoplanes couchii TaxID=403638 RepID=A0ABQ3XDI2_9ACTN|nr:response regulator transcription factor [Actinoplanes couchii]MDR6317079.1 DNA-binding response OmpR family regulator [Actinoplanes couchii]GID56574.1 DNA-binding response regulator [Actinoplanes couchii]